MPALATHIADAVAETNAGGIDGESHIDSVLKVSDSIVEVN